jgi:hypothetical protein
MNTDSSRHMTLSVYLTPDCRQRRKLCNKVGHLCPVSLLHARVVCKE